MTKNVIPPYSFLECQKELKQPPILGCDDDDEILVPDNATLFNEMQDALGGANNINTTTTIKYKSTGVASEFQEDPEPINGKVADYNYSLLYHLDGTQSK